MGLSIFRAKSRAKNAKNARKKVRFAYRVAVPYVQQQIIVWGRVAVSYTNFSTKKVLLCSVQKVEPKVLKIVTSWASLKTEKGP